MSKDIFLTFDFGPASGKISFANPQDLHRFLDHHIQAYHWLVSVGNNTAQLIVNEQYNYLVHTRQIIANESSSGNIIPRTVEMLSSIFISSLLPVVGSSDYEFIENVRTERGGVVAAAALSYIMRKTTHLHLGDKDTWDGLFLSFVRQEGISKASVAASRAAFDRLNAKFQNFTSRSAHEELQRELRSDQNFEISAKKQNTLRRWKSRQFDRQIKKFEEEKQLVFDEIATVRKTYEEMMKLKAPVEYWTDKSKSHRSEAKRYRQLLLDHGWKVSAGVLAGLILLAAASFFFAQADKPATAYLLLVTIGVVITTMAFWAARIVVRLYMSEHHLAIDAEERATMAMTYLALIERGAAEEKDRALILAPLFRPSSDGIVKDDAAPDLSPAALLSKALSK